MLLNRLLLMLAASFLDVGPRGYLVDEDSDDDDLCHVKYFNSFGIGACECIDSSVQQLNYVLR